MSSRRGRARTSGGQEAPPKAAELRVRLTPRAKADEIAGEREGELLVRVGAPPVDGRANAALCKLLARHLGVAGGRVNVVKGATSRVKTVEVEGLSAEQLRAALRVGRAVR